MESSELGEAIPLNKKTILNSIDFIIYRITYNMLIQK